MQPSNWDIEPSNDNIVSHNLVQNINTVVDINNIYQINITFFSFFHKYIVYYEEPFLFDLQNTLQHTSYDNAIYFDRNIMHQNIRS